VPIPCRSFAIVAVLLVGACASSASGSGDYGVSAVQFQDFVVPDGMSLVDRYHESYSGEAAGWRFGHFEYVGQTQLQDACSHLLQRMPQHMWRLASDESPDESQRAMKFERGRFCADYKLERKDGVTYMVVDYRTQVGSALNPQSPSEHQ
jgi:hypothetical protein